MKNLQMKETASVRRSTFDMEANSFFNEYYDLTGEEFPPCDQNRWNNIDEWFTDLKLAVYRERANIEVYGRNYKVIPLRPDYVSLIRSRSVS